MSVDNPTTVRVDRETRQRLEEFAQTEDASLDDVLCRVLERAERSIPIEEVVDRIRMAKSPAQIAVHQEQQSSRLMFQVHVPPDEFEEQWTLFDDIERITIDGWRYRAVFDLDYYGPNEFKRISVWASDSIIGMEGTEVQEGISELIEWLASLPDDCPLRRTARPCTHASE